MESVPSNARKWSGRTRCSTNACAEVEAVPGGKRITSTITGAGEVFLTDAEFAIFRDAVKAGELDTL